MSDRTRRRRKLKFKNIFRLMIILGLLVTFVYSIVKWNLPKDDVTYFLGYGEINMNKSYRALIIRKELMLTSSYDGKVTQVVNEGARVKKNEKIVEITGTDETIESESDQSLETVTVEVMSLDQMDLTIDSLKKEIALAIRQKDYSIVADLAEELKLKIESKMLFVETNDDQSSFSMTAIGDGILDVGESLSVYSTTSGILTYYMDGFEDDLTYENIFKLQLNQLENMVIEPYMPSAQFVSSGDVLCKIVDDSSYYLILLVDKGEQNTFNLNEEVNIHVDNKYLYGTIEEVISMGEKVAIALRVEEFINQFYKERFIDVTVSQDTIKGLNVKTSSIVKTEQGMGVYVVNHLDKVLFKPIQVIAYKDGNAIVKENVFHTFKDDENVIVNTVSKNDRVIIQADQFKPGDTIR